MIVQIVVLNMVAKVGYFDAIFAFPPIKKLAFTPFLLVFINVRILAKVQL
ncbi:MAG: hypothetical protein ACTTJ3_06020 [Treponema sp.]